jgi:hypothetical protein
MLFLIILLKALVFAVIAFVVGAAVALLLWLVGLVTPLKIPAFIRWGGAGLGIAIIVFGLAPDLLAEDPSVAADWRRLAEGTNKVCMGLACAALALTGLIISLTKMVVKGTVKGVKAASNALAQNTPPQPPPLP